MKKRIKNHRTDQTIKIPATVYPWQKRKMKGIWSIDFEHVFRKQFPNRYYIYEEIRDETDAGILKKTNEFITEFERRNYQMDYEIGYIQNENDILSGVYDNYTNAVILPFKSQKVWTIRYSKPVNI